MIYLLDTDSIIFMIRGLKQSVRDLDLRERAVRLMERCRAVISEGHSIGVSAITVAELEYGVRRGGRYREEMLAVEKICTPFEAFAFDAVWCPSHFGRLHRELELIGQPIGTMDSLIAAQALSVTAVLVTNNVSHFQRVPGLVVENWYDDHNGPVG